MRERYRPGSIDVLRRAEGKLGANNDREERSPWRMRYDRGIIVGVLLTRLLAR